MSPGARLHLYTDLATWWPVFSPPSHYVEEAQDLLPTLLAAPDAPPRTMLELGSGGGSLAFHFKAHLTLTLSDLSAEMLAMSRQINPECEHVQGDMRTLDVGRQFDLVFIHDAIMYMLDPASIRAALATAYRHCRPGGALVVVPDCVRETFEPTTSHGGEGEPGGRALRYLEWTWDPDPSDDTCEVAFAFLLREPDGTVHVDTDHHQFGLFARQAWLDWFHQTGFAPETRLDPWQRDVFTGRKPGRTDEARGARDQGPGEN
jgi:SAM-dependent methyltransferase